MSLLSVWMVTVVRDGIFRLCSPFPSPTSIFVDINLISNDKVPLSCSFFMFHVPDLIPDSHSMISFVITHTVIAEPIKSW